MSEVALTPSQDIKRISEAGISDLEWALEFMRKYEKKCGCGKNIRVN